MAKINRFSGNVKAIASESQAGERYVFGSTSVTSNELTDQFTAELLRGWGTVGAADYPPLEWFNSVAFTATQFNSYLHQMGVPEWDALQEYPTAGASCIHNGDMWARGASWVLGDEPGVSANWISSVKLTGDQSIDGVKTFTASPIVPTPTTATQAANKSYIDSIKDALFPVGRVILSMGIANPSAEGYPGTWSLLYTAGASVKLGSGAYQNGVASGDNNPAVPLLQHNHTASFAGNALPDHSHTSPLRTIGIQQGVDDGYDSFGNTATSGVSAGTPTGSVTVNNAGSITPTLDVSGKGVAINFWERTS